MNFILKAISYIFHPLLIPILGVLFYFHKTPRFVPDNLAKAKLISIFILTILLPLLIYQLLRTLKKVDSIHLSTTRERIMPLLLNSIILLLIIKRVLPFNEVIELYYFFIGILISNLACLILAFLDFKASIHMIAVSGLFMFFIALSIHFSINILGSIALVLAIGGAVATSRLHLKAHTVRELIMGCFVGLIPQLLLLNYWL